MTVSSSAASEGVRVAATAASAEGATGQLPWHVVLLRFTLFLCGCDAPPAQTPSKTRPAAAKPITVYYDLAEDLVRKQLEFRRLRKSVRDASTTSLSSLGTVSEDGGDILLLNSNSNHAGTTSSSHQIVQDFH